MKSSIIASMMRFSCSGSFCSFLIASNMLIVMADVRSARYVGAGRIRLLVIRVNRVECYEVGRTPVPHVGGDVDRSVEVAGS